MKNEEHASEEAKELIEEWRNLLPKWISILSESSVLSIIEKVYHKIVNYGNDESMEIEKSAFYFNAEELAQDLQNGIAKAIKEDFKTMIDEEEDDEDSQEFNENVETLINDFQQNSDNIIKPYLESVVGVEALGAKLFGEYTKNDKVSVATSEAFDSYVQKSLKQYDAMVEALTEKTKELLLAFWTNIIDDLDDAEEELEAIKEFLKKLKNQISEYDLEQVKREEAFNKFYNEKYANHEAKELIDELRDLLPKWTSIMSEENVFTIIEKVSDKIDNYIDDESMEIEELAFYFNAEEIAQNLQDGIDEVINEDFRTMICEKEDEDYSPERNLTIEILINNFQLSASKIIKPYLESIIVAEALGAKLLGEYKATDAISDATSEAFDSYMQKSSEQYNTMVEGFTETIEELTLAFWTNIMDDLEEEGAELQELKEMLEKFQNQISEYESLNEEEI